VRIIAATNKDLKHEAETNRFRQDLFYRLAVFTIHLPPLAERTEDIEILANHFLKELSNKLNRKIKKMDEAFLKALNHHTWRGNIRELKNVMERAVIIADGDTLTLDLLNFDFFSDNPENSGPTLNLANIESQYIRKAMSQSKGNKTEASRLLGIGLSTLYRKIEDYNL
jgi:DNA-binding NtrC family response regulator